MVPGVSKYFRNLSTKKNEKKDRCLSETRIFEIMKTAVIRVKVEPWKGQHKLE